MTDHVVLRDVTRLVVPFSVFIGLFGQGLMSAAAFGFCALGIWIERSLRTRARAANELESA